MRRLFITWKWSEEYELGVGCSWYEEGKWGKQGVVNSREGAGNIHMIFYLSEIGTCVKVNEGYLN